MLLIVGDSDIEMAPPQSYEDYPQRIVSRFDENMPISLDTQ